MPCDELPDELPDDLKIPWKEAGMNGLVFSPDQLRAEAEKIKAKMRRLYLVVSFGFSSAVASYAFIIFTFHYFHIRNALMLVGSSLSVVGFGYLVIDALLKRSRALAHLGETDGLRFYRTELERKRDWIRGIAWRLPMVCVAAFVVDLGVTQELLKISAFLAGVGFSFGVFVLGLCAVWVPVRNSRMARKYQERIDALESAMTSAGRTDPKD
jgi:hypothetical protein